jgi:SAM-dependent methyltransferase
MTERTVTQPDSASGAAEAGLRPPSGRSARIRTALACPKCHRALDEAPDEDLVCATCGRVGRWTGTRFSFGGFEESELRKDPLNRIKESVKQRFSRLYPTAIAVLAPVLTTRFVKPFLRSFDLRRDLVADLGSGTHRRNPNLVCVDGGEYDQVDIVTDLRALPLAPGSLAGLISVAVLEHVPDPQGHIAEMRRVLAPGGRLLCFIPFMQPFHASPFDFQRFTDVGMREQFKDFEIISVRVGAGPTSALVWVLQEWLALVLSLGSMRLYRLITPLTWILSPLKLLDLLLARHPNASVIASGFVVEARKPLDHEPARQRAGIS